MHVKESCILYIIYSWHGTSLLFVQIRYTDYYIFFISIYFLLHFTILMPHLQIGNDFQTGPAFCVDDFVYFIFEFCLWLEIGKKYVKKISQHGGKHTL
jgi:hypothetical protein